VISQFLFKSSLDPLRDFVPVTVLVDVPLLLAVTAKHPARTVGEFLADLKANPGKLNFGSPGRGTPPHLAGEMLIRSPACLRFTSHIRAAMIQRLRLPPTRSSSW